MVQGNCTSDLDQIFAQLLFQRDYFNSCFIISLLKISYYNSTSLRGSLNKINNRYDTILSFWDGPQSVRGSHTPNLVEIIKGLVTLYAFSPFQITIRHTTAPCRIQPVSDQTYIVVVPFHRWTTCGPMQLHTEFGPNIRPTFIPEEPLSFMFSRFTIQNFRLQFTPPPLRGPLNKIENR